MARLGPTHGANTGSQAPIFWSEVLEDRKAVQRAEAIGGFGGDEIVIAMGDMVKKHRKSPVVAWPYS